MNKRTAQKIAQYSKGEYHIAVVDEIDSTNRAVRGMAEADAPEGTVLFAEQQTAGKGRMGRSFFSPAGSGLYFSILLRPQGKVADPLKITAAAGVAVAEAVDAVLGIDLQIKWVNDLYLVNKKVCGILAEGAFDEKGGLNYCVLGIGINVFAPKEGFGALEPIAGALAEKPYEGDLRARLAAMVLDRFFDWYSRLEEGALMEQYRRRSYLQDRWVTALRGEERIYGRVVGIREDGALLLEEENGASHAFLSGEVRLEDYR